MLYRLLNNNKSYHFIAIPLLTVLLWVGAFINPQEYQFSIDLTHIMPLSQPLFLLTKFSYVLATVLAMLLTVLNAFLLVQLNIRYMFLEQKTFIPAYIYVIVVGGLGQLHYLHPIYVVNILGTIVLSYIFNAEKLEKVYGSIFNVGLLFGIGSLLYFNVTFIFPIIWIAFLFIYKTMKWRHFILSLMGFLLPWVYVFSYYYFIGYLPLLVEIIKTNMQIPELSLSTQKYTLIYIGILALLMLFSSVLLIKNLEKKGLVHRYFFQTFLTICAFGFIIGVFIPSAAKEILLLVSIPVAFILTNYLIAIERKFWANVIIYLLLIVSITFQFL